jgi:hypothetical protein
MIMKNKFYLTKTKTRAAYFALSLLFLGLFSSTVQAQNAVPTHVWKANTVGNFNVASNWDTFTVTTLAITSSAFTTLTSTVAIPVGIQVNDVITGGTLPTGTTVTSIDAGAKTITFSPAAVVTPGNATYYFSRTATASVPAVTHTAQITSGTCTVTANTAALRGFYVGNASSSVQGKVVVNSGVTLSVSSSGSANIMLSVRGGLITNNGIINATASAIDGRPIRFDNAAFEPDSDWGIIGTGTLTLVNTNLSPTSGAFLGFAQTTVTRVPRLVLNSGSTVNLSAATAHIPTYNIFSVSSSGGKGRLEGTGISATGTYKPGLFGIVSGASLDVASTVSLTNDCTVAKGGQDIVGTLNNAGTIAIISGTTFKINAVGVLNNTGIINNLGTINNLGNIVNKSTATGSGSLTSTTSISNVTQERYLGSNQRGWRLLSNPLAAVTYGTVATTSTTPLTLGAGSAKTYNAATNTWTISNTDNTQTWASKGAVSLFVRGITSEVTTNTYSVSTPSNVTVSIKGTATYTAPTAIATTAGKFYLVANPYTAPVSVSSILAASTGLSTTVSYYNPTIGSNGSNANLILKFGGYNNPTVSGAAGSATDVVIPAMGAIFVQASSAGTINVPTTAVFTGTPAQTGTYNHRVAQKSIAAANSLKIEVKADNAYYDTVALRFRAAGDASSNIDFGKLPNDGLNAYSFAGINKMAVSELELSAQTIALGVTSAILKSYTFEVAENTIPDGFEAVLFDSYLNKNTVLAQSTNYEFAIDSNPASQGDTRFVINLKIAGTLGTVANKLDSKFKLWPNPTRAEVNITNAQSANDGVSRIEISNLNGQLIHSQKSNPGTTSTIQTKNWAKGVYILKASNNGTETTKKLIIQ